MNKMIKHTYFPKVGDLVSVEAWDCEGVEMPWGWADDSHTTMKADVAHRRVRKVKIKSGTLAMVIRFDHFGVDDYDTHYNVIVEGMKLGVPLRFIRSLSQDPENNTGQD